MRGLGAPASRNRPGDPGRKMSVAGGWGDPVKWRYKYRLPLLRLLAGYLTLLDVRLITRNHQWSSRGGILRREPCCSLPIILGIMANLVWVRFDPEPRGIRYFKTAVLELKRSIENIAF